MSPEALRQMASVQHQHWWFVARRQILDTLLRSLHLPADAELLDLGCGTGVNLAMLARHGRVHAMEFDAEARRVATEQGVCNVEAGRLPDHLPFAAGSFDLVCLLDVLEHLADDASGLASAAALTRPGGRLIVTVPAYDWLWSAHDVSHHHQRRYTRGRLTNLASANGLETVRVGYFNTLLFPMVAGFRLINRLRNEHEQSDQHGDAALPSSPLNRLLYGIFAMERHMLQRWSFPFGVSVMAIMRRPI